jgi:hypothetical protein
MAVVKKVGVSLTPLCTPLMNSAQTRSVCTCSATSRSNRSDTSAENVVLVGAPGAGKGTRAARLADRLGVPHVASGELLRQAIEAGTPPGTRPRGFMDRRELVPVDLVLQVVLDRLGLPDAERGFILDGCPLRRRQLRRSTPLPTARPMRSVTPGRL